jgi:RHS repeat-associated protein
LRTASFSYFSENQFKRTPSNYAGVCLQNTNDYSPFGVSLDGRTMEGDFYRRGFQGMEGDSEIKGAGNAYDFGARMLDLRIGRWFALDQKAGKYPMDSPYIAFGDNPIMFIDPDGKEKIVVVGSEGHETEWKLKFALPGMNAVRELKKIAGDEQTTLLLFKAGYSDGQIKRIQKYVNKKGVKIQVLTHSDDLVNYINNKSITDKASGRTEDPITHLQIYAHGTITGPGNGAISFGYHQEVARIESDYRFDKDDVAKVKPSSFSPNAFIISYACRTGAGKDVGDRGFDTDPENSLAQNMADVWGVTIYALQRRSDYQSIIIPDKKLSRLENYFDSTFDNDGGSWDTDAALNRVGEPKAGTTPAASPGWTEYKKGKSPKVLK